MIPLQWFNDVNSTDISDKCEDVLDLLCKTHGCEVSPCYSALNLTCLFFAGILLLKLRIKLSYFDEILHISLIIVQDCGNCYTWAPRDAKCSSCFNWSWNAVLCKSWLWRWVCFFAFFEGTLMSRFIVYPK